MCLAYYDIEQLGKNIVQRLLADLPQVMSLVVNAKFASGGVVVPMGSHIEDVTCFCSDFYTGCMPIEGDSPF